MFVFILALIIYKVNIYLFFKYDYAHPIISIYVHRLNGIMLKS